VPALQQAAGPCITAPDCAMCAKKVVALLQSMQSQLERERQKHVMEEQRVQMELQKKEEAEREKLRQEKRAAKERRRKEEAAKWSRDGPANGKGGTGGDNHGAVINTQHEMERLRTTNGQASRGRGDGAKKSGWCWSFFMFMMGIFFIALATGVSLLWIYTGGKMDQRSIEKAMPIIRKDIDLTVAALEQKTGKFYQESRKVGT
jgi:hypothetical protein